MRAASIKLRALTEQRGLIDQAAILLGKNHSDFILEVACDRPSGFIQVMDVKSYR